MKSNFRFHHIGIAVKSIAETATVYELMGGVMSDVVFDSHQNVSICWITCDGMPTIELLEPVDDKSPVNKILEKNGVTPYHICYEVDDLDLSIMTLRKHKYVIVSRPVEAPAISNHRVAFLFHKDMGLIELVEIPR